MDQELGGYLRSRRKAAGLTQKDLQELTGVDQTVISKLENGERTGERSRDKLVAISKAIGADVDSVLVMAGIMEPRSDKERREAQRAVERAILADPTLTSEDRAFLLKAVEYVRRAGSLEARTPRARAAG